MDSNTTEQKKDRFATLEEKYGKIKAFRYFWFGEPAKRLTERDPKLPWYAQGIFYASSAATLLVFASSDIVAYQHANFFRAGVITLMIGLLMLLVFAMDKGVNRTIPRMFILLQRGETGMFFEHLAYVAAVSIIEMVTLFIVIIHENDIDLILTGKPLIAPGSFWFLTLAGSRAFLALWTVIHSFFVNEALPIQWGTLQREATELIGGQAQEKVKGLDLSQVGLAALVDALVQLFHPAKQAARTFRPGDDRRQRQAVLDLEYRKGVVATLERLDAKQAAQVIVVPDVPAITDLGAKGPAPQPPVLALSEGAKAPTHVTPAHAVNLLPFGPDDPRLKGYVLPANVALDDLMPLSRLATTLDAPQTTLYEAMSRSGFVPQPPFGRQPGNTQNYFVWQVLALVEDGLLDMPKGVRKATDLALAGVPLSESLSA